MSRFTCPACQRSFAWKPELAGREAKCKCGHALRVPLEAPVETMAAAGVAQAEGAPVAPATPATPAVSASLRPRTAAVSAYPTSRRPTQEEPASSTKMYVILGAVVLVVAMGVGGWIIFRSTGGADANRPRLGDDAQVEQMIADNYPKDLTEWVQAHPSRMLGGKTANQAVAMEKNLKQMGATKVLAFGAGVLCRVIAIELPSDPAKRKAIFEWHNENLLLGEPRAKDVGQKYVLHEVAM